MTGDRDSPAGAIAALGEHALIARIRDRARSNAAWIATGIGDDAAVLVPDRNEHVVVTTDIQVEGVHFDRAWTTLEDVGYKALAVNLSDLAAMGARPRACLLSLALPPTLSLDDFDAIVRGFLDLAEQAGAPLVGGNLSRSPGGIVVDVTAIGSVHPRRVLQRGGGRPGDLLFVSGSVGGAAAGLAELQQRPRVSDPTSSNNLNDLGSQARGRLVRPTARWRLGRLAAASRAVTACVDLSDGLADAVSQLAAASGVGAVVDGRKVPLESGLAASTPDLRALVAAAAAGGEDYELLFAVAPKRRRAFLGACARDSSVPVTQIGELTRDQGVWLEFDGHRDPLPASFRHF